MSTGDFLPAQNLMTLVGVLVIAVVGLLYFLRKRSNRKPMEGRREENIAERIDTIDGRDRPQG